MQKDIALCRSLTKSELLSQAQQLSRIERECVVDLIARLSVIDESRAFKPRYRSMFDYCLRELGFSEPVAYGRIRVARLVQKVPDLLDRLRLAPIPLAHLERIAAHLTRENMEEILPRLSSMSFREVDRLAASLSPRPDTADCVRRLPAPATEPEPAAAVPDPGATSVRRSSDDLVLSAEPEIVVAPASVEPKDESDYLSKDRVLFRFTGSHGLMVLLKALADLLARKYQPVRLEHVVLEAALALRREIDPASQQDERRPIMTGTRHIPRWVKRIVARRDGNRCAFVDEKGCRCQETRYLEYDHIIPWALGGRSDDPQNIRQCCRAHNQARARGEVP